MSFKVFHYNWKLFQNCIHVSYILVKFLNILLIFRRVKKPTSDIYVQPDVPAICRSAYNASSKSSETNFEKKTALVIKPLTKKKNIVLAVVTWASLLQIDDPSSGQTQSQINTRSLVGSGFIFTEYNAIESNWITIKMH